MGSLLAIACSGCGLLIGWWLLIRRKLALTKVLLGAFVVFGLFSILVMQPGSIPDEAAHIQTAYRYANVLLLKPYATENGSILARSADVSLNRFARYTTPYLGGYGEIMQEWQWLCPPGGEVMVEEAGRDVSCGMLAYLPAAIGMALARILHLGTWPMIYLGRLANLACFFAALYWAVKITPYKKELFLLLGLVPTAVQAAGSYSYDAVVISFSLLVLAWVLHLMFACQRIGWREWLIGCAAAFLLFPCKLVPCAVFLLLVFVPKDKFGSLRNKVLFLCCVFAVGIIGFIVSNLSLLTTYMGTADGSIRANELTSLDLYPVSWIAVHPLEVLQMILRSIREQFSFYLEGLFIGRLTRFDLRLFWAFILLVVYVLIGMQHEKAFPLSFRQRASAALIFGATALVIFVTLLVDYTPLGSTTVVGVQGRYFLPILPLLLLSLDSAHLQITGHLKRWLAAIVIACNAGVLCDLFYWIVINQGILG